MSRRTKTSRKTAGQLAKLAAEDRTRYDPSEVAEDLSKDTLEQLFICAERHKDIFWELDEYCVVEILASDPMLKNLIRRKYYAWPFLPKPRPRQSVYLYNKHTQKLKRLWVLPPAHTMASLSSMITVHSDWKTMKGWSDAFFDGKFWEHIRQQHNIKMLSEHEHLKINAKEIPKSGLHDIDPLGTESFDFTDLIAPKKRDTIEALAD